jgi:hypothetical protein
LKRRYPEILIIEARKGLTHLSWKEVKSVPKHEKKGKAEKMAGQVGKGVDKGLHKGWDAAKGVGKGVEKAATGKEEHEEHEEEEKED